MFERYAALAKPQNPKKPFIAGKKQNMNQKANKELLASGPIPMERSQRLAIAQQVSDQLQQHYLRI